MVETVGWSVVTVSDGRVECCHCWQWRGRALSLSATMSNDELASPEAARGEACAGG